MRRVLKMGGGLVAALVLMAAAFYVWASIAAGRVLARTVESHAVDFPIPFPLSADERRELGVTEDQAERIAAGRALERGRHLVEARYVCIECHGGDFSGGVMVDDPMIGRLLGPNLTAGKGSRTKGYAPRDWDHIVRHGLRPDNKPAAMPSEDFQRMTDQELSDVVFFVRSHPPVDNEVPAVTLGPLGKVLLALGKLPLSVDLIESHDTPHRVYPPPEEVSVDFGRHVAGVCMGCHRPDLAGGPIVGGDPSWVPARNLTPHTDGLSGWTYEQFVAAMREGRRPDGSVLRMPMIGVLPYAQKMTEVEMRALWTYLQSVPAVASRE